MPNTTVGPNTRTVDLAGGALALTEGGSGQPLVLLHHDVGPFGWTPFHEALAEHFHVFAIDMPGWGESPRADWARHPRDIAAIILHAARALGLRNYTLVGSGLGGWVAAEMLAFAYPEMASATLIGPAGIKPTSEFILDQVLEEHVAYLRAGFSSDELFAKSVPDPKDKQLRARLDAARETVARVTWKPYMYSYELPETLRDVQLPVAVAWGTGDRVIPASTARLWGATLPHCTVHEIEGAGHFAELEHPGKVASIVLQQATALHGKE
jgi:pimeloyl-ACP methyl ester carboxylesterase